MRATIGNKSGGRPVLTRLRLIWDNDGRWVALLGGLYLAAILIIDPRGDFPLNDDWSFAGSARTLAEGHGWHPIGWAAMTQITHALIGVAACVTAPCTHETLRGAELLAGFAVLLCCYGLFRCLGATRLAAALGAGSIVLNPILLPLAFTFMTDVDFTLLLLLAFTAGVAMLTSGRWRDVGLATALIIAATMSRQLAIVMTLPLFVLYMIVSREHLATRLIKGSVPLVICISTLQLYERWMRATGRLPTLYDSRYEMLAAALHSPVRLAVNVIENAVQSGLYLGLVCLPLLLWVPLRQSASLRNTVLRSWAALLAHGAVMIAIATLAFKREQMPTLGNVLGKQGIGPFTLRDTYILHLPNVSELPPPFWTAVTALGLLGLWRLVFHGVTLVQEAWPGLIARRLETALAVRLFGALALVLYLLPLLPGPMFDRYPIAAAPLLCAGLALGKQRRGVAIISVAASYTVASILVAVLGTHDYLAWNRARWSTINAVVSAGEASPATMDGGFEYNGQHAYDERYVTQLNKSWWWVSDDRIIITFGRVPGMELMRLVPYETWLPPGKGSIAVLRRKAAP